jgi:phosphoribosylanthranilate isomerase
MTGLVKVCGVKTLEGALAAARAGADILGFVFEPRNARTLKPDDAEAIVTDVKRAAEGEGFKTPGFAGVFADAGERLLAETAPFLTHFQFHGHEGPERVAELGSEFGVVTIRAIPAKDVGTAETFEDAADLLLFRAPDQATIGRLHAGPGGTEWGFLRHYRGKTPFLIAGGLNAQSVKSAIEQAKESPSFAGVDVTRSVEKAPGEKEPAKVDAFIVAARSSL